MSFSWQLGGTDHVHFAADFGAPANTPYLNQKPLKSALQGGWQGLVS